MLDFKWSPDLWGGKRAKYEAAVGRARAAQVDAQAARLTLSSSVARSYIALAQACEILDVEQREQARASRLRDLSRQRVDAGLVHPLQDRKSTRLNPSHECAARMTTSALQNKQHNVTSSIIDAQHWEETKSGHQPR